MIPFLDLSRDFAEVEAEARRRIDGVLARQQFVLGPETEDLERLLERRFGFGSAVAVSSGTEALALSLLALGIGRGDAVVLPAFTFFSTAGAVWRAGAVPVFCDIDPASFLAGAPEMQRAIESGFERRDGRWWHRASGARLAALMPVHLYGRAVAMPDVVSLAQQSGARVIEDAAQAIGARVGERAAGRFGDAGCISFYPTKNLGGPGDGGLVVCEDEGLAQLVRRLRTHGTAGGSYEHDFAGINARMPELVAAVLVAKLDRLEGWTARRRSIAALYDRMLQPAAMHGALALPAPCEREEHVWHQYAVRVPAASRDAVRARLEERGISTRVFYPLALHLQPCFASLGGKAGDFPESERASREVLCLPMYPSLDDAAAMRVAEELAQAASESAG